MYNKIIIILALIFIPYLAFCQGKIKQLQPSSINGQVIITRSGINVYDSLKWSDVSTKPPLIQSINQNYSAITDKGLTLVKTDSTNTGWGALNGRGTGITVIGDSARFDFWKQYGSISGGIRFKVGYDTTWDIIAGRNWVLNQLPAPQTLAIAGNNLTISGGNTITIPGGSGSVGNLQTVTDAGDTTSNPITINVNNLTGNSTQLLTMKQNGGMFTLGNNSPTAGIFTPRIVAKTKGSSVAPLYIIGAGNNGYTKGIYNIVYDSTGTSATTNGRIFTIANGSSDKFWFDYQGKPTFNYFSGGSGNKMAIIRNNGQLDTMAIPSGAAQVNSDWNATTGVAQILNKPTSLPPSGAAGGDLSGSYPNPTVAMLNGQLPSYYLDRANHTGTQTANTISDFTTAARASLTGSGTVSYNNATGVITGASTNLGITGTTGARTITSSTGTSAIIPIATTSVSGVMTPSMVSTLGTLSPLPTAFLESFTGSTSNTLTLTHTPVTSAYLIISLNGQILDAADWTIAANVITLANVNRETTDKIIVYYSY